MTLNVGQQFLLRGFLVRYVKRDSASGGRFRPTFVVYVFNSEFGEIRLDNEQLKDLAPATKLHKLLAGFE